MLSRPDDWIFYENEISDNFKDGLKSIRAGIQELIEQQYIERKQLKNENGKFAGYEYIIHETSPLCRFRKTDFRKTENRKMQNGTLLNNDLTKNDLTNNEKTNKGYRLFSSSEKSLYPSFFDFNILELQIRQAHKQADIALPIDEVIAIFRYFIEKHQSQFDFEHPKLSQENIQSILENIAACDNPNGGHFDLGLETYKALINSYFDQKFDNDCNYSIVHFMSGDIRANCCFKTCY